MNVEGSWLFYWLIAAVVVTPIVMIVKGITAGRRGHAPAGAPEKDPNKASDAD